MLSLLRRFIATASVVTLGVLAPLHARAADFTDLWFMPSESGWGVNVVQSDKFMFLTFFIYGADNKPTWYTAQLTSDAQDTFSGGLYETRGTYYANPWNTGDAIPAVLVGSAQFRPSASNNYEATLTYVVNGVGTFVKAIQRQTLTGIRLGGSYVGGQAGALSGCSNSGPYTANYNLQVTPTVAGDLTNVTLQFTYPTYVCTLKGTTVQTGSQYTIAGAEYKCTQGDSVILSSTANVTELKATAQGIEGRWTGRFINGCTESVNFSAALL